MSAVSRFEQFSADERRVLANGLRGAIVDGESSFIWPAEYAHVGAAAAAQAKTLLAEVEAAAEAAARPETITFERDGETLTAVVGLPTHGRSDALVVESDGVRYAISFAMGEIPGYPGVPYIARPIESAVSA